MGMDGTISSNENSLLGPVAEKNVEITVPPFFLSSQYSGCFKEISSRGKKTEIFFSLLLSHFHLFQRQTNPSYYLNDDIIVN